MQYDFSAEFLRISPPDTSFGEAWESLCEILLRKELDSSKLVRLRPPDLGVDMLYRLEDKAFQCKSCERGVYGRIDAEESARSLETATRHKSTLGWCQYSFATNAEYTGAGYEKILLRAKGQGVSLKDLEFLGPAYWNQLCIAHSEVVQDRFDYRISVNEKHLLEVLQKNCLKPSRETPTLSRETKKSIIIANNLTQLQLEHDLPDGLSVEAYLKVLVDLLGLSEFLRGDAALAATIRPLFSLRIGGKEVSLFVHLKDLGIKSGDNLEFHIKSGEDAFAVLEKVIMQFPDNIAAQAARAGLLKSMGRLNEALSCYQAIIARHPENLIVKAEYAEVLRALGRLDDALASYDDIMASHPESVTAAIGRAEVLKEQGQLAEALSACESTLNVSSDGPVSGQDGSKELEEADTRRLDESRHKTTWDIERLFQSSMWRAAKRLRLWEDDSDTISHRRPTKLAA